MEAQEEVIRITDAAAAEARVRDMNCFSSRTQKKGKSGEGSHTTPSGMGKGVKAPGCKTTEDGKRRGSSPVQGNGGGVLG